MRKCIRIHTPDVTVEPTLGLPTCKTSKEAAVSGSYTGCTDIYTENILISDITVKHCHHLTS